ATRFGMMAWAQAAPVEGRPGPRIPPPTEAPPTPADRIAELIGLAQGHEQAGRLTEAEEALGQVLALAPQHAGALHLQGVVNFRQGRIDEAVVLMERSIAAAPETALYHRNICEAYRSLGRYDAARPALLSQPRCPPLPPPRTRRGDPLRRERPGPRPRLCRGAFRDRRGVAAAWRFSPRLGRVRMALSPRQCAEVAAADRSAAMGRQPAAERPAIVDRRPGLWRRDPVR